MLSEIVSDFVTFFVVLDPVGVALVGGNLTRGMPADQRWSIAWRGTLIAAILLLVFAFGGAALLQALGISLPALRVAGGLLLFLLSVDMVFARPSGIRNPTGPEQAEASHRADIAVFPLAFPLLAGPGALTTVVLLMERAGQAEHMAAVIAMLLLVLALALLGLLAADRINRLLGITGANVVSRLLGVILAALAAQFVIDGLGQALHGLGAAAAAYERISVIWMIGATFV